MIPVCAVLPFKGPPNQLFVVCLFYTCLFGSGLLGESKTDCQGFPEEWAGYTIMNSGIPLTVVFLATLWKSKDLLH